MGLFDAVGGIVGGIIGNQEAAGDRGQARNQAMDANSIIQRLQNAPPQSRPILLEQYRQQGLINPQNEAIIQQQTSKMEGIQGNQQAKDAQMQALQQLQERSIGGLNAADRAGLNQARQAAQTDQKAKQAQIMQEFAQRGQGGMGAELAAKLSASQNGANSESQAADRLAQMANQNALQATAQMGGLGGQIENQAFGEAGTKASAADQMNRFNIQNQIGQQQRNVAAQNQAQYANLNNAQNINNMNVSTANQESQRQRQGEQQDFNNTNNLANMKSNALTGNSNYLQAAGDRTAQGAKDIGTGIGGLVGGAMSGGFPGFSSGGQTSRNNSNVGSGQISGMDYNQSPSDFFGLGHSNGGEIHDYRDGGHVDGKAKHEGDHPENDTVPAMLSPGEIVIPRSVANSSLGDKLLDLLKHHHEIKTHLDGIEKKANKPKKEKVQNFDGGTNQGQPVMQDPSMQQMPQVDPNEDLYMRALEKGIVRNKNEFQDRMQYPDSKQAIINQAMPKNIQSMKPLPVIPEDNSLAGKASRFFPKMQATHLSDGGYVGFDSSFADQFKKGSGFSQGGFVSPLEKLYNEYNKIQKFADGTSDGNPVEIPVDFQQPSVITGDMPEQPIDVDSIIDPTTLADKQKQLADIKSLDDKFANEDKKPASNEISSDEDGSVEDDNSESSEDAPIKKSSKFDASSNALKEAQDERKRINDSATMGRFGDLIGSGIAKAKPVDKSYFDDVRKGADLPVKSFEEQVANQVNDPNSTMTKVMQDYLKAQGMSIPDDASASDLLKVAPFLAKDKALQSKIQVALANAQTKKDISDANREVKVSEGEKNRASGEKKTALTTGTRQNIADMNLGSRQINKIEQDPTIKRANDRINSAISALAQLGDKSQPLTMNRLNAIQIDLANTLNFMSNAGASDYKAKSDKLENLNTMIAAAKQKYGTSLVDLRKEAPEVYNEVTAYAKSVKESIQKIKEAQEQNLAKKYSHEGLGKGGEIIKDIYKPKQNESAAGVHNPGDIVMVKGKQYRVGADGDSLEEVK